VGISLRVLAGSHETGALCQRGEKWPFVGDPNRSAMAVALGCLPDPRTVRGYLWSVSDLGNPSTIFLAAAAMQCSRTESYFDWRMCQIDSSKVTPEAFAHDAAAAGMGPYIQARTLRKLELAGPSPASMTTETFATRSATASRPPRSST
jgi:hypothetical protein